MAIEARARQGGDDHTAYMHSPPGVTPTRIQRESVHRARGQKQHTRERHTGGMPAQAYSWFGVYIECGPCRSGLWMRGKMWRRALQASGHCCSHCVRSSMIGVCRCVSVVQRAEQCIHRGSPTGDGAASRKSEWRHTKFSSCRSRETDGIGGCRGACALRLSFAPQIRQGRES